MAAVGSTSIGSGEARSVGDVFRRRVKATPELEAFSYPDAADRWRSLTWAQVDGRVRVALVHRDAGVVANVLGRGDVGIVATDAE